MTTPATPAAASTPAAGAAPARRGFARGAATSAPAAGTAASTDTAGDASNPAEPEQGNAAEMLVNIDFDAALQHSSDGVFRGEIFSVKPTKGKNGFYIGVRHEDGTPASCNYMLFRAVKDAVTKMPQLGAAGKPVMEKDLNAQKAWANFCACLGLAPQEVAKSIVDFDAQKTPEKPVLVGMTLMWTFKQNGDFLNCSYNDAATQTMLAAGGPSAA